MPDLFGKDFANTVVGERYRIISLLGEGAMGNVYLADDEYLKRKVAIKVLRDEWGGRLDIVKRLENECRLMAHLGQHPNIVSLIDRQVMDGKTLLVMEYAPGETLSQIINRTVQIYKSKGPEGLSKERDESLPMILTPDIAYEIATQCMTALDYAHGKGILHLDIKPGNIMIQSDSLGNVNAKLMDFGIGRTRIDANLVSAVTALTFTEGAGLGTPAYMAPEQIDPERFGTPGPAADLYSLGVTLFEMFTLQLPFLGAYTEVLHAHANTRPPNPRDYNPELSVNLSRVILTALRKSPGNRYHSASEMLTEWQKGRFLESGERRETDVDAEAPEKTGRYGKLCEKIPRLLFLSGVLLFVVLYWRLDWQLPLGEGGIYSFMQRGGLTVRQARESADAARRQAAAARSEQYAAELWEKAEKSYTDAVAQETGGEAARLYAQAQVYYDQAFQQVKNSRNVIVTEGEAPSETSAGAVVAPGESVIETEEPSASSQEEGENASAVITDEAQTRPYKKMEAGKTDEVSLGGGVSLELAWIPEGTFYFGSESFHGEQRNNKQRGKQVWLPLGFWIGRYEVLQKQWMQVMGANPSKFQGDVNLPVDNVSWKDCQEFINRLNKRIPEGGFRLPTEAEWEYAARSGVINTYMREGISQYAWHSGVSNGRTHPVGGKRPNSWGLYDTLGNLWEWVQDWYVADRSGLTQVTNPMGPPTGLYKVLRGGAWSFYQEQCTLTSRTSAEPGARMDTYGFRIARDYIPVSGNAP
ncbi:MAG: SUMF1/EgtB/PvdO family nonheme iron enzyme [Candidatus Hydrogenedentes bacterium]|nr:SUMF1/EgtB/PvdO family nonheme iron enzyme [Candidatus Hydrogenedentota bacterium]